MTKTMMAASLLLLTVAAISASAQNTSFNVNITFNDGAVGQGTFTTDTGYTTILTWTFSVTGGSNSLQDFSSNSPSNGQAHIDPPAGCPDLAHTTDNSELVFANSGFTAYSTVCLSTALTATGATVDAPNSTACPGCAVGVSGTVTPAAVAPTFTKAFGAPFITVGQTTSLTFTVSNPSGNPALTSLAFTDPLPAGLTVASFVSDSCGGTVTATPGSSSVSLSGGSVGAGASTCTVVVDVTGVGYGAKVNTTSTLTSNAPASTVATATLQVLPADAVQIGYAANLSAGNSYVDITNAGTIGGSDPADNICANVYVFAQDQQLIACCACPVTPNDLQSLSSQGQLVNNTLTPGVPTGITTMLIATTEVSGQCHAAVPGVFVPGMRAWGTTLHATGAATFAATETPFQNTWISATEYAKMTADCAFILADGSGAGLCGACQNTAAGASKQVQ